MKRLQIFLSVVLLVVVMPAVRAADVVEVQVEQDSGAYHIYFEILIDAPKDRVYSIISDYGNLEGLSPGIISSELQPGEAGQDTRIDLTLKPCVWKLCRKIRKVSTITINAYGAIVYTTVPEESDFKRGREQVIIKAHGPDRTRVTYNAALAPDFFVPPLIGSWLIRRQVQQNLRVSLERVEQLAAE